jgi:fluoride ion exporter CrcB/FEX
LELARDGRLMHAGANIMLSVVLCLTAVALGHWLAALFGRA